MAGALPAKKGRPEREAGERVAAHALTSKPPQADRVAVWKTEMSEAENAEFEEAAGYLLDDLGYETATPKENWIPPEEWARSKSRNERGSDGAGIGQVRRRPQARLIADPMRLPSLRSKSADARPRAGRLRRRHEPLRHDAAADDARRPPAADDPARDPLRPRPDQGRPRGRRDAGERARGDEVGPRVGRLRLLRRGDARAAAGAAEAEARARRCGRSTRPTWPSRASRAGARRRRPTSRR